MKNRKLKYSIIIIASILLIVFLPIPIWLKPVEKWGEEAIILPLFMILLECFRNPMGLYYLLWFVPLGITGLDYILIKKMQEKDSI